MTVLMKRRQLTFAAAVWCAGSALAADRTPAAVPPAGDAAQTFRALRAVPGHFNGGVWNDDVDRWQGRKHVAMQRMAEQALRTRATAAQLQRSMGVPDAGLQPGNAAHARAIETAQWLATADGAPRPTGNTAKLWLYRWRGQRDQLVLALEHDRVVAAGWLYEWE